MSKYWLGTKEEFQTMLMRHMEECASLRWGNRWNFSAQHLKIIFRYAIQHYAQNGLVAAEFHQALRHANSAATEIARHISSFIANMEPHRADIAATIVAPALCVDAYPPAMHSFLPDHIFGCTYEPIFRNLRRLDLCEKLKYQFALTASENNKAETSALVAHLGRLRSFAS
ncbi:hypothetical protein BX600DRAFT_507320 [Xylariales sp. PMI_506]|nr:hypothetical protein BX600DRAFT_507320 [Xylariales sp. PMI_506]